MTTKSFADRLAASQLLLKDALQTYERCKCAITFSATFHGLIIPRLKHEIKENKEALQTPQPNDPLAARCRKVLEFLIEQDDLFDGYGEMKLDRYEYACTLTNGNDEPTKEQELEGFLMMMEEAMKQPKG